MGEHVELATVIALKGNCASFCDIACKNMAMKMAGRQGTADASNFGNGRME